MNFLDSSFLCLVIAPKVSHIVAEPCSAMPEACQNQLEKLQFKLNQVHQAQQMLVELNDEHHKALTAFQEVFNKQLPILQSQQTALDELLYASNYWDAHPIECRLCINYCKESKTQQSTFWITKYQVANGNVVLCGS